MLCRPTQARTFWQATAHARAESRPVLQAGSVKKISQSKMPFPQRENILAFINSVRSKCFPAGRIEAAGQL